MNKIFYSSSICFFLLFMLASCASSSSTLKSNMAKGGSGDYLAPEEVSIGDWLVYILSTSFTGNNKTIKLGDHNDIIKSKLPVLGRDGLNDYTIRAFLSHHQENVAIEFYNDCHNHLGNLAVGKASGDSIKEYKLMDLPIVGITFEQAMQYVEYLQHVLDTCDIYSKGKYRYECYLPSPEQFDAVRLHMDSTNVQGCNLFNYKNSLCPSCPNGNKNMSDPIFARTGREPTYTWGYYPDSLGVKNLNGNVAEMTSVKGIAKGGSCVHYAIESFNGSKQEYSAPEMWLGFRVWFRKIPN
jgi:hypothetical protein